MNPLLQLLQDAASDPSGIGLLVWSDNPNALRAALYRAKYKDPTLPPTLKIEMSRFPDHPSALQIWTPPQPRAPTARTSGAQQNGEL